MKGNKIMDFGDALKALKAGERLVRKGWNGKGIFIELQVPDEHSKMTHPYIYIDSTGLETDNPHAPKNRVPWFPSQTDLLAIDYEIVKEAIADDEWEYFNYRPREKTEPIQITPHWHSLLKSFLDEYAPNAPYKTTDASRTYEAKGNPNKIVRNNEFSNTLFTFLDK